MEQTVKRTFSRIGLATLALVLVSQVVSGVFAAIVAFTRPSWILEDWFLWASSFLPIYVAGFPVFALILRGLPKADVDLKTTRKLSARQIFTLLIALFGMMYVLNIGTTFILSFISAGISFISGKGFDFGSVNPVSEILLNSNPGYLIAIAVLIGPMIEEIMFRKLLLPILEPFGGKAYIFMSAFLFSLFHGNLNQIPYAFVVGVVLGAVYWFTHDLRYTILLHIMLNFLGSGVSVLLLNFAPELAWVWTVAILALMVAGIVIAARWWIRHKKELVFLPGAAFASRQDMLVNPGMISYMALTGLIVIFTFFAY